MTEKKTTITVQGKIQRKQVLPTEGEVIASKR